MKKKQIANNNASSKDPVNKIELTQPTLQRGTMPIPGFSTTAKPLADVNLTGAPYTGGTHFKTSTLQFKSKVRATIQRKRMQSKLRSERERE